MINIRRSFDEMASAVALDPSIPLKRIYDGHIQSIPNQSVPEYRSVRTALQRVRETIIPSIPRTINDVAINGEWAMTWDNQQFLSKLDNNWGYIVFATRKK